MRVKTCVLVLCGFLVGSAWAEPPVYFEDVNLKAAVEAELWILDPTPTDMLGLTSLVLRNTYSDRSKGITSLTGLEYAANLTELDLRYHRVSDLSPLSGLSNLESLALLGNDVSDVSPLSGLANLEDLDLESNQISDISGLAGCPSLRSVCLHRNVISDLWPLTSLTNLEWLNVEANPLSQDTCRIDIPQIRANNPGVLILGGTSFGGQLVISSTPGGSVISPGEGVFDVTFGDTVRIEAKADPCFVFAGWSGTWSRADNPLFLLVDQDYALQANFVSVLSVIHVDDNAPSDPSPGNLAISDPRENGTAQHPFDSVQEAIEVARNGSTVFVHAGTYFETIDLLGKRITLTGFDPADPNVASWPVIDGNGSGPVVSFTHGEGPDCRLSGLVLTGGNNRVAAAVYCSRSSPTIAHCLIVGNQATDSTSAAVYCMGGSASLVNCTIADNSAGAQGAALYSADGQVTVVNCIFWANTPRQILTAGMGQASVSYSLVSDGRQGVGNIAADPLFARASYWAGRGDAGTVWMSGDYHVQSQAGRWDPVALAWVEDSVTSPCIDAGDPASAVGAEPAPNGGIINMGAYGGTAEAGKSRSGTL